MKVFREPDVPDGQLLLLPPNVEDFVPPGSRVRVLSDVIDKLDCRSLRAPFKGGGAPAYDPVMLFKVLVLGCSEGIRSSRRLANALTCDLRYMYLARMSRPDFRTIARFRQNNEAAITDLFLETVVLAKKVNLVVMEHASVDGTKLLAQGSKRQYKSAASVDTELEKTRVQIAQIMLELDETDAAEDKEHGDGPGDGVPEELRNCEARKKLLEQAKAELDKSGVKSVVVTDPQCRMMMTTGGVRPAFNAQAEVDAEVQIIVAASVTQEASDNHQLRSMLEKARAAVGVLPKQVTADGGYWSKDSLDYVDEQNLDAYIAPSGTNKDHLADWSYDQEQDVWHSPEGDDFRYQRDRHQHGRNYRVYWCSKTRSQKHVPDDLAQVHRMRSKVATQEGKGIYKRRQAIVEPVFGHLKGAFGLRKLLLRGLSGARIEFFLACSVHNLMKIAQHTA